jgi:uncharacterized protein YjiK
MIGFYLRIALISFSFLCCSSPKNENTISKDTIEIVVEDKKTIEIPKDYNFETPSEIYVLSSKLREISGLTYDPSFNLFLSNNDEEGKIFTLDPIGFNIKTEQKFAKRGDFEAIAKVDEFVVVSKNTGTLYFYNQTSNETKTYNTKLNARNDVEGMCFDKESGSLLLACKGQPIAKVRGKKNEKCVYLFDLEKKKLNENPFLTVLDSALISFVESSHSSISKSKLKQLKRRVKSFAPSGIAIQPVNGDYYLTSGRGSILVIFGKDKRLKDVIFLNSKSNPQPEGITFDKDSNLYISTEGKGYSGKIFKFAYIG